MNYNMDNLSDSLGEGWDMFIFVCILFLIFMACLVGVEVIMGAIRISKHTIASIEYRKQLRKHKTRDLIFQVKSNKSLMAYFSIRGRSLQPAESPVKVAEKSVRDLYKCVIKEPEPNFDDIDWDLFTLNIWPALEDVNNA